MKPPHGVNLCMQWIMYLCAWVYTLNIIYNTIVNSQINAKKASLLDWLHQYSIEIKIVFYHFIIFMEFVKFYEYFTICLKCLKGEKQQS